MAEVHIDDGFEMNPENPDKENEASNSQKKTPKKSSFAGNSSGTSQITLAWTMSRKKCIIVCVSAICLIVVVAAGVSAGATLVISLIPKQGIGTLK